MNKQRGILIKKPISLLKRALKADYSKFTEALTKTFAYGFVGNVENAIIEAKGVLSALGLRDEECPQVAWFLIHSSLLQAVKDLVDERITSLPPAYKETQKRQQLIAQLDSLFEENEIFIDHRFFEHPEKLSLLGWFETQLSQWLADADTVHANKIINDLPPYFVFALRNQWRANYKAYECLKEILDDPFAHAHERELAWLDYAKWLQKQVDEVVLDERFSLRQVYVPLRAYFEQAVEWPEKIRTRTRDEKHHEKIVVDLKPELEAWVQQADPKDAVRLISGGPGCGKSSFVKVFAAHQAKLTQVTVLFIPLYRLNIHRDLREALNEFAHDDDYLPENPLEQKKSKRLLLIFDGLDEYAIKSKAANEAAQQFVDEVYNVVHQSNYDNTTRLQAIITGRDVAMQANARKFSKSRKTLHILGYYVPDNARASFQDANQLLAVDQRDQWWQNYGQATGHNDVQIPAILKSAHLVEITSQPLLNYLVALSYEGGKLDFSAPNNLNRIYRDLLERLLEREQEKSPNSPLANMEFGEFFLALKEVALAAWHGDGRTTTAQDIQHYFEQRGLQAFSEVFQDQPQNGVIRLLLAFYFRQTGVRDEDAQRIFEFTHKSFGEYLVACRIVDMVIDIQDEMVSRRKTKPHLAWDGNDALQHWIKLCGIKPLDRYLFNFICDEMRLQDVEQVHQWQKTLASLIEHMLKSGMPMERLTPRLAYPDETRQARNAEEALLATLNACARVTQQPSQIKWPSESAFGEWVYRIQGQSPSVDQVLLVDCLSFLDLHNCQLSVRNFQGANFFGANLEKANLDGAQLRNACFEQASLKNAHLEDADLMDANLTEANLEGASLNNAYFAGACLEQANLKGAMLKETSFYCANLKHTHFEGANLKQADLEGANYEGADFSDAIWTDGKKYLPNLIGKPI